MGSKRIKIINADKDAWLRIRIKLPCMSDTKRTRIIDILLDDKEIGLTGLIAKLDKPELSDSKADKYIKKIMREMLNGR